MSAAHARFAPSAAERWINCPGSLLRAEKLPPAPAGPYADRGTALHALATMGLTAGVARMDLAGRKLAEPLTPEEASALRLYVNYVNDLRRDSDYDAMEHRFCWSAELFGTVDFACVKDGTLHVVDLKTGAGVFVPAQDNPQLLTYAVLVRRYLVGLYGKAAHDVARFSRVMLHVVQPLYDGADPVRTAAYDVDYLSTFEQLLQHAMHRAKQDGAPLAAGDHCRFCPVKSVCPELQGLVTAMPPAYAYADMTVEQLGEWLLKAEKVEQWIGALREIAHEATRRGLVIPGWKLVDKRANRKWTDERKVLAAAKLLKIHVQELKLLSPAQVEAKYVQIPAALQKLISQKPSGQNLVRDDSTLPAPTAEQRSLPVALKNLQYRV